jgi:hypothetical protein
MITNFKDWYKLAKGIYNKNPKVSIGVCVAIIILFIIF